VIGPAEAEARAARTEDAAAQRQRAFEHLVRAAVTDALERVIARITPCPQCGALFLKSGKMQYCTRRCGDKASWQRFRAARALGKKGSK
jgi:hypothetical protein